MLKINASRVAAMLLTIGGLGFAGGSATAAVSIEGQIQAGGGAVANSTVTLWGASSGEPRQLAQTKSGNDGHFAAQPPKRSVGMSASI